MEDNGKSTVAVTPATPPPPPPPAQTATAVTKWLAENHAYSLAKAFYKEGYFDLADVDEKAIDELVPAKGTARRLKASLAKPAPEAMVPPGLPEGTALDLSKPELESPEGVAFTIPSGLSVEKTGDAVRSPSALGREDWLVIAFNSALLYGFVMDGPAPARARRPVLEWVVPKTLDFVRSEILQARVESVLTYTEETATYVRCGFEKQTASAGYAFCAASFERSRKERTASRSETRQLHATGLWKYPRATLFMDECTRVSSRFKAAIRKALKQIDPAAALHAVFQEYGHVVPQQVTLGGQLHFDDTRTETGQANEKQVEQEIKAAVEAKVKGITASTSTQHQTATSESSTAIAIAQRTSFDVLGGDATLASTPAAWASTVKDPHLWAAIENSRVDSVVNLLSPELRTEVLRHWRAPEDHRPAAIDVPLAESPGVRRAATAGFLLGMRQCVNGERGSVFLASGRPDRQELDGAAAGEAFAHSNNDGDVHYDVNSAAMPVRADTDYGSWVTDTWGKPVARTGFARCDFDLGEWTPFAVGAAPVAVGGHGFLFVSIDAAEHGWRGGTLVNVDGRHVAGASVHWWEDGDNHLRRNTICIPVRAGSKLAVERHPNGGQPRVTAAWMPLGDGWAMQQPVRVEPNTRMTALTDGIFHGYLTTNPGERARILLYTGKGGALEPWAAASVHSNSDGDRWGFWSSAMLPVGKGAEYMANYISTWGGPPLQLTWTPITPV